jgi:hypothetical protein
MAQHTVVVEQAPSEEKKKRKKLPLILAGVGMLALVPLVGSTFAASISLGTGNVEFGQGTQTTAACDDNIGVALGSQITSGQFYLQTITLKDINFTDTDHCLGKTFKVHVADSGGNLQDWVDGSTDNAQFTIDSSGNVADVSSGVTVTKNANDVTVTIASPALLDTYVGEVLLETSN